jgi:hypothetical protein
MVRDLGPLPFKDYQLLHMTFLRRKGSPSIPGDDPATMVSPPSRMHEACQERVMLLSDTSPRLWEAVNDSLTH